MNIQDLLSRLQGVRSGSSNQWSALCPAHDDSSPSLSVKMCEDGAILVNCHGGCTAEQVVSALGLTMVDLAPASATSGRGAFVMLRGLTVAELAKAKKLSREFLESLGVTEQQARKVKDDGSTLIWGEVVIPYYNLDGTQAPRYRRRFALKGKRRFAWNKEGKGAVLPYGLHKLEEARLAGYIVLVEGETDCWTLWLHGFPALGFPGAKCPPKMLRVAYVKDVSTVYVLREPGKGGATFVNKVGTKLAELKSWTGTLRVVTLSTKDPSDLHLASPEKFHMAFQAALDASEVWEATQDGPDAATPLLRPSTGTPAASPPSTLPCPDPVGKTILRPFTDLGNAERLVDVYGKSLRYCPQMGKWLLWDGTRWYQHQSEAVNLRAYRVVRGIYVEAKDVGDDELKLAFERHAERSENAQRIRAMLELAQALLAVPHDMLDADPCLLNCLNGTVDLRTGELRPHNPADLITKRCPASYDPQAEAPRWEAFLDEVMSGNRDLCGYLQRAAGYSLTGSVVEQCLFFCHGHGANGKSTFAELLLTVLGEYAQKAPRELLLTRRGEGVPTEVARLAGARLVVSAEVCSDGRFDEARVKDLTGGDRLAARFMHHGFFEFLPSHKLWIHGNHRPMVRGTDRGIWRRIQLIPFEVTITPERQDKNLTEKLKAELPGILAWAVQGALLWGSDGLQPPPEVTCATEDYRQEMDVLGQFIADCCRVSAGLTAGAKPLYEAYCDWASSTGEKDRSQQWFGRQLRERGFATTRPHGGRVVYEGIGLPAPVYKQQEGRR